MNKPVKQRVTVVHKMGKAKYLLLMAVLTLAQGCVVMDIERPEFHFLSEKSIQEEMTKLADVLGELSKHVVNPNIDTASRQRLVLAELDKVSDIAGEMGGDGIMTNFAVMNQYMGAFLYDVNTARKYVNFTNPDFKPAGQLMRSCQSCHSTL